LGGELCAWVPAPSPVRLAAALRQVRFTAQSRSAAVADGRGSVALNRPPVRVIRDPYPTYSAVAVDPKNNEIVLQDENLFQLMVYDRMTNTPPTARLSEPKRIIGGHDTKVEVNCGVYIDPKTGDLYYLNNESVDAPLVFSRSTSGHAATSLELRHPLHPWRIA